MNMAASKLLDLWYNLWRHLELAHKVYKTATLRWSYLFFVWYILLLLRNLRKGIINNYYSHITNRFKSWTDLNHTKQEISDSPYKKASAQCKNTRRLKISRSTWHIGLHRITQNKILTSSCKASSSSANAILSNKIWVGVHENVIMCRWTKLTNRSMTHTIRSACPIMGLIYHQKMKNISLESQKQR